MGVDYSAEFGIGYEVGVDNIEEECPSDFLDENLPENVYWFRTGNDWTGNNIKYFIVLSNPFELGLDLSTVKLELDAVLCKLNIQPESKFGVVGGLSIY